MDRRTLIVSGLASLSTADLARAQGAPTQLPPATPASPAPTGVQGPPPPQGAQPSYAATTAAQTYSRDEIINQVSDFLGVTAEAAGAVVERVFAQQGRPTAYIAGEEGSGAFGIGLRYGQGLLYMKDKPPLQVFWQGPSNGWDVGGNASRVFTLCYNLQVPDAIFQRFPGVEGTAYLVGGVGVNYQAASGMMLAPIRTGVGLRLGANVGYLAYTRERRVLPF
jgi:hypothetical protein